MVGPWLLKLTYIFLATNNAGVSITSLPKNELNTVMHISNAYSYSVGLSRKFNEEIGVE